MWARDCYATTFARTLLDVRIGDMTMGQECLIGKKDPLRKSRNVEVDVLSSEQEEIDVVLVRNGEEVQRASLSHETPGAVLSDADPLDKIAVRDAQFHTGPFVVYYVRLETGSGETQWSSPIWLDLE